MPIITDYLVIGAGVVGLATALHLKSMDPRSRVVVVEREAAPGAGDTGKSMAAFRTIFTSRVSSMLARSTIALYQDVEKRGFSLGMTWAGYLFVLDSELKKHVDRGLRLLGGEGENWEWVEPSLLEERLGIRTQVSHLEEADVLGASDVVGGVLVRKAGFLDADRVVEYYFRESRRAGVEFVFEAEVERLLLEPRRERLGLEGEPFPWQEPRVSGALLSTGDSVRVRKKTIVAAGVWANKILNPIGVDTFSRPKKRQVFRISAKGRLAEILERGDLTGSGSPPLIILPKKVLVRPAVRERSFWVQLSDDLGRPYTLEEPPSAEEHYYNLAIHPVLSLYMPPFSEAAPSGSWAGHYDVSFDGNPIVYEPYDSDLIVAGGTSGSGIMKADGIGRVAAALALGLDEVELYTGEKFRVSWLGLEGRLCEKELLIL